MERGFDPVCGMNVSKLERTVTLTHQKETITFCGEPCKERFAESPEKYLGMPLIRIRDVWKVYQKGGSETAALRGLDLHVWEGDFMASVGASGSGKSTVLNMIGLLDRPTKGNIWIRGRDVATLSEDERSTMRADLFGFIFQQYNLIPWLSAEENAMLPRLFTNRRIDRKMLAAQFEEFGLKDRMRHHPVEMSGGEQQRTAILRSLANDPNIILGDEPTGNLDSATGERLLQYLVRLHDEKAKTLIVVTHDPGIAEQAHQIIAIKDGRSVQNHRAHQKMYAA